jgi:hypothetical protein
VVAFCYDFLMVKTRELAITKAGALPEAVQELLECLDALSRLRAEIDVGIGELDAGQDGEPLDIAGMIAQARNEHGAG